MGIRSNLEAPLLAPKAPPEDTDSDEESSPSGYFSDHKDDDSDDGRPSSEAEKLPKRLRWHRTNIMWEYGAFGKVKTVMMYIMYLFVVVVTVAFENSLRGSDDLFSTLGLIGYVIWQLLLVTNGSWVSRQHWAWGGYPNILLTLMYIGTIVLFSYSFHDKSEVDEKFPFRHYLLVFMAFSLFIDQQIVDPAHYQLYLFYKGKINPDEEATPVTGISNKILQQAARDASIAIGIHEKALPRIERVLAGHRIRQDKEEALDDLALLVNKLARAVSLVPFSCRKSKINTLQYRNLTRQILLFLRSYLKTGKMSKDAFNHKRTLPLSTFESLGIMFRLSWQVKWTYLFSLVPGVISAFLDPLVGPLNQRFLEGVMTLDMESAKKAFALLMLIGFCAKPILNFFSQFVVASFVTKLSDHCRRKMLGVVLKGGTKFSETHRNGKLNDAFTNQVNQLEIFTLTVFAGMIAALVSILSSVAVAFVIYPTASILFVSLVPIVISIDYFTVAASRASVSQAVTDGKLAGKISSIVECRPAIRSCNAGAWINSDLKPSFEVTRNAHYRGFLKSGLVLSAFDAYVAFYSILIFAPIGSKILRGEMPISVFFGLLPPVTTMSIALAFLGGIQSQISLYSGPLQTIKDLMDHSLDEEPPSKIQQEKSTMKPLSDSMTIKDVNFRYGENLPNVLSEVKMEIPKGSYTVLCGPSGSGKSSVLNLLMRFREPNEGSVDWDGTNIYNVTLESFREQVGVMFQKTMIYQTTIRENILFGLPEQPGGVEAAAVKAEIHNDICRLPDGYDSVIGGDAIGSMSGGQMQRICLARALYRKPSVLLLDEATSALDAVSEHAIMDTLVKLRDQEGLTLVSVSHHPSTAVEANRIVVLERGVISEEGTYQELVMKEGGIFRSLVEAGAE